MYEGVSSDRIVLYASSRHDTMFAPYDRSSEDDPLEDDREASVSHAGAPFEAKVHTCTASCCFIHFRNHTGALDRHP